MARIVSVLVCLLPLLVVPEAAKAKVAATTSTPTTSSPTSSPTPRVPTSTPTSSPTSTPKTIPVKFGIFTYNGGGLTGATAAVALHHVNENNGTIAPFLSTDPVMTQCPYVFSYGFYNSQCSAVPAMTELINLANGGQIPDAILGPSCSSSAVPMSVVSRIWNIPMISPSATSTDLNDFPLTFSSIPADSSGAFYIASYCAQHNIRYLGMIYDDNDAFGRGYKDAMFIASQANNINLKSYPVFDDDSMSLAMDTLKNDDKLNVIVMIALNLNKTMTMATKYGLTGPGKLWIFADNVSPSNVRSLSKDPKLAPALNNTIRILAAGGKKGDRGYDSLLSSFPTWNNYINDLNAASQTPDKFEQFNFTEDDDYLYEPFGYDAAVSAAYALCKDYDEEKVLNVFSHTGSVDGPRISDILLRGNFFFEGASGKVSYDEFGRRNVSTSIYKLESFRISSNLSIGLEETIIGGYWNQITSRWDFSSDLLYAGGSTTPPQFTDGITTEENHISDTYRIIVFTIAAIVYLLIMICIVWISVNRNSQVMRASQPMFLNVVLFGVVVSTTAVFPLSIDGSYGKEVADGACMASWWLWSLGTTITSSALICKLYRIKVIFNQRLKRVRITTMDMLKYIGILVAADVLILTLWNTLEPLTWHIEPLAIDQYGREVERYGSCEVEDGEASGYLVAVLIFQVLIYIYGVYIGVKIRNAPTDLQEGKWIGISMISQVYLLILGVPIVAVIREETGMKFFILGLIICIINLVLVLFLFGPKMYRLTFGEDSVILTSRQNSKTVETKTTTSDVDGSHFQTNRSTGQTTKVTCA